MNTPHTVMSAVRVAMLAVRGFGFILEVEAWLTEVFRACVDEREDVTLSVS